MVACSASSEAALRRLPPRTPRPPPGTAKLPDHIARVRGIDVGKYAPVLGATHSPPMKLANVVISVRHISVLGLGLLSRPRSSVSVIATRKTRSRPGISGVATLSAAALARREYPAPRNQE